MTLQLSEIRYRIARELGQTLETGATGGSTTTIVDTVNLTQPDDYWNGGTAWILNTTDGLAPEGEIKTVTDFVNSTGTLTLNSALTATAGAGDTYAVADATYPRYVLGSATRAALGTLGLVPDTNTSITTAAGQSEYTLPAAVNGHGILQVHIQGRTSASNDNQWTEMFDWHVQETGRGVADKLVFSTVPANPYLLRLTYLAGHASLFGETDQINEAVPIDLLVKTGAYHALVWRKAQLGSTDPDTNFLINEAKERMLEARRFSGWNRPRRSSKLMIVNSRRYGRLGRYGQYINE